MNAFENAAEVKRIKSVLLETLVKEDGPYFDGRKWITGGQLADSVAARIVNNAPTPRPSILGYLIVDRETKLPDWDGELHPSVEDSVQALTGPHHYCRTVDQETEDKTYWGRHYMICPVEAPEVGA